MTKYNAKSLSYTHWPRQCPNFLFNKLITQYSSVPKIPWIFMYSLQEHKLLSSLFWRTHMYSLRHCKFLEWVILALRCNTILDFAFHLSESTIVILRIFCSTLPSVSYLYVRDSFFLLRMNILVTWSELIYILLQKTC